MELEPKKQNYQVRFKFEFDLPCRTSPRRCSWGYPGGGFVFFFYKKNIDKY